MAKRAPLPLTGQTRTGRSSPPRSFTTRRRQPTGETFNVQRSTFNVQRSTPNVQFGRRYFPAGNLSHERVETWIAAQIVKERIYFDDKQVSACSFAIGAFQLVDGLRFFAQGDKDQRLRVRRDEA